MQASTVLLTGGSGLLALNWAVTIRDRHPVILGLHQREIALSGTETRPINLESVEHLVYAFGKLHPQIIIHTAGLTNVEECEAKPVLAQHVNVKLAVNVAKACAKLKLQLVHISTDHLFAGDTSLVDESHPIAPVNVYGRTKAEAELRVIEAHPQTLVIRTNFYGWSPSYRHSFSDAIIAVLRSGNTLTLFQDVFYTPILIEVATQAAHELIDLKAHGIFHVVGDERISKYEFGLKIAEEFNLDCRLIKPGRITDQACLVQRPHDMSLSNRKACNLLGRTIGGINAHITRLHQQEQNGLSQEIHNIGPLTGTT